jgi:hypothetical protein
MAAPNKKAAQKDGFLRAHEAREHFTLTGPFPQSLIDSAVGVVGRLLASKFCFHALHSRAKALFARTALGLGRLEI